MARNDGVYLELAAEKEFKKIKGVGFFWRRLYDSKSARNIVPANPADFFASDITGIGPFHLECKSQKSKTCRLNKFSQLQAMKRWSLAGVVGKVLVHFWEVDRFFLVDVFDLEEGKPSWVLNEDNSYEVLDVEEAIKTVLRR